MKTNAVSRLKVETAIYDASLPYRSPRIVVHVGSSFVAEINKDHVILVTNAHVVADALNIECYFPFLGEKAIPCSLMSYCYFMDVALVKVKTKDIPNAINHIQPLKLADDLKCKQTDEIAVVGYPLGEKRIQIAKGNISGFVNLSDKDMSFGPTSYIQVTAPVNPGNSGGPGLNNEGEVVGIVTASVMFTNNIGYLVPINNILSVMRNMFKEKMLYQPFIGIVTNPSQKGLYVRDILPVSIFNDTQEYEDTTEQRALECLYDLYPEKYKKIKNNEAVTEGDIIHSIEIVSVGKKYLFDLDEYGTASLPNIERLFTFKDIGEMIDLDSNVTVTVMRNGKKLKVTRPFESRSASKWMVRTIFPTFEPERFTYILLGGLMIVENIDLFLPEDIDRFKRHLVVSHVFSGSTFDHFEIEKKDILIEVNNQRVYTIEDIKNAMKKATKTVSIRFKDKKYVEADKNKLFADDKRIMKEYR